MSQRGKQNPKEYALGTHSISLAPVYKDGILIHKAGDIIYNDALEYAQNHRIYAEERSLRESFGQQNMDDYIRSLKGTDIQSLYNKELVAKQPKPWRLAILSSLLAYQARDLKQLYSMYARKTGHLMQIATSISENYDPTIQKPMIFDYDEILSKVEDTFTHRLIEFLGSSYYTYDSISRPIKAGKKRLQIYKKNFYRALCAYHNADLQTYHIDNIIALDEEIQDSFTLTHRKDNELGHRMVTELQKYDKDYSVLFNPATILSHDVMKYDDIALCDYIDSTKKGIIRCCAVWLYILNAPHGINLIDRLEKYGHILVSHEDFIGEIEEDMEAKYNFTSFNHTYSFLEQNMFWEIVQYRSSEIEEMVGITEDIHQDFVENYSSEHAWYMRMYQLILDTRNGKKLNKDNLLEMYQIFYDVISDYDIQDEDGDDEEEIFD